MVTVARDFSPWAWAQRSSLGEEETMLAIRIHEPGGPEVLRYEEVDRPEPGPGQVLIELRAAALNHRDIWTRLGRQGARFFPVIPGSDGAGVVAAVGPGVGGVQTGDEVVINSVISDGTCEFCLAGQQSLCDHFNILGTPPLQGTYAEYVVLPAAMVYPKPRSLSWEEAAAFPLSSLTAYHLLVGRAQVRPGEVVLILGVGGGVAMFALQLAKLAGATAIVTSSSDAKLARAKELGADAGINYVTSDWVAEALRLTAGRGADIVVETVGAATWSGSLLAVRKGGRIAVCGGTTGNDGTTNLRDVFWRQVSILGSTMGNHREFVEVLRLYESGKLRPVIDSVVPLADAAKAHARMDAGTQFGKIVLRP